MEQVSEVPGGDIDGSNTLFTLSHVPNPNTLQFFRNGVLQLNPADYTINGRVVAMTEAPTSTPLDTLYAVYIA